MGSNNVEEDGPSGVDQMKRKLQHDLSRFLNNELDYAGVMCEIMPPTRLPYADSPYGKPYSDLNVEFTNFKRALNHWERLINRLTASAGVTQIPVQDPLQELVTHRTFEERVAMLHNLGPRSHVDFPFERWTICLALFFDGLLGNTYMPFPFKDLVPKLRVANQSLYDTIAVERK
jgi:hypothetical protein